MFDFLKDSLSTIIMGISLLLVLVFVSFIINLYDKELAIFFIKYVLPTFFLLFFVSIFKDSYKER